MNAKRADGMTALMIAAESGQVEVVKLLLDRGAAVNREDKQRLTALMWASGKGHLEIARLLLAAGADVHTVDVTGRNSPPDCTTQGPDGNHRTSESAWRQGLGACRETPYIGTIVLLGGNPQHIRLHDTAPMSLTY